MAALRGDISFRYLKQFFLVKTVFSNYLSYVTHVSVTLEGHIRQV